MASSLEFNDFLSSGDNIPHTTETGDISTCTSDSNSVKIKSPVRKIQKMDKYTYKSPVILKHVKTHVHIKPFMSTRGVQVRPATREIGVQVGSSPIDLEPFCESDSEGDASSEDEDGQKSHDDPDYLPETSDDSDVSSDEEELGEPTSVPLKTNPDPSFEKQILVRESALAELFSTCTVCTLPTSSTISQTGGTLIVVEAKCSAGHRYTWKNQTKHNGLVWGNVNLAAAILFSGSSLSKSLTIFRHFNVPVFSQRTFFKIQIFYLVPSIIKVWKEEQRALLEGLNGKALAIGGDGRCDSPGYSAKYGSYTVMNLDTKQILHSELVQSNEVNSSSHMELEGLKRSLKLLTDKGCTIREVVTDRHSSVKKYMREKQPLVNHYFDVWHVSKGVTKKLEKEGKKKKFQAIQPWIRSVGNHMFWVAASSGANGALKQEKWLSVLNHVADIHEGHGELFQECDHGELDTPREWLRKGSKPYKKLAEIVAKPLLVKDISKLSPIHQTYSLEVFHNVVNHFASKQQHFFYDAMQSRVFLAVLHFNENRDLKQRKTKDGVLQWRVCYPKAKKGEVAVVKAVKELPTYGYVDRLKWAVKTRRLLLPSYSRAKAASTQETPGPLTNNFPLVKKAELVERRRSRFK